MMSQSACSEWVSDLSDPHPDLWLTDSVQDPNDADAKYVHFFHEKIPSRYACSIMISSYIDASFTASLQNRRAPPCWMISLQHIHNDWSIIALGGLFIASEKNSLSQPKISPMHSKRHAHYASRGCIMEQTFSQTLVQPKANGARQMERMDRPLPMERAFWKDPRMVRTGTRC